MQDALEDCSDNRETYPSLLDEESELRASEIILPEEHQHINNNNSTTQPSSDSKRLSGEVEV